MPFHAEPASFKIDTAVLPALSESSAVPNRKRAVPTPTCVFSERKSTVSILLFVQTAQSQCEDCNAWSPKSLGWPSGAWERMQNIAERHGSMVQ